MALVEGVKDGRRVGEHDGAAAGRAVGDRDGSAGDVVVTEKEIFEKIYMDKSKYNVKKNCKT